MAILTNLGPWSALSDLQREMDQLVRTVFGSNSAGGGTKEQQRASRTWVPAIDVYGRGDNLVVRAELAGVDPEKDVEISVEDGALKIAGHRRMEHRQEDTNFLRVESSYGAFERTIPLPDGVKAEEIKAVHRQGILEITVPLPAQVSTVRKVPVQIAGDSSDQKTIAPEAEAVLGGEDQGSQD
jgi:HSP20 family protein